MTKYLLTVFAVTFFAFFTEACFAQGINWQADLEQASQLAARENKLVLLHFGASWCRPCHALNTYVFSNPRVQRAMQDNVIPVKIDVDKQANLVREYGVASVPFDVVITPAGRVVSKRSSPRDASAYGDMINGFSKIINGLANGNPALHEQLDQLKDEMFSDNQIVETESFEPAMPVHRSPSASLDSAELKRKSRILNPFTAVANQPNTKLAQEPNILKNDFAVQSSRSRTVKNPMANAAQPVRVAKAPTKTNDLAVGPPSKATNTQEAQNKTAFQPTTGSELVSKPSSQSASSDFLPKPAVPVGPQTVPVELPPAMPAENSFSPQQVAATPPAVSPDKSINATGSWQTPEFNAAPSTNLMQTAEQTEFQPADIQATFAPVATAKLRTDSQQSDLQKSVSASLVIPKTNLVMGDSFFKDEKAAEPATVSGDAQIILDSKSRDLAKTVESKIQAATHSHTTNSTANSALPNNVALHGKCPITLLKEGIWLDGDAKWGCVHRDRTYLFASEANMREFQKDPDANSPLLAGYDPVIFHASGELVDGKEAHGVFMGKSPNQRVVLFSSAKTRAEFESNPRNYIETIRQAMRETGGASSKLLR